MTAPSAFSQPLPRDFIQWAIDRFGHEHEKFIAAFNEDPVLAVRRNPGKASKLHFTGETVPWCTEGMYLNERPNFARDPWWHAGAYYVQDASSMILGQVIQQCILPEAPVVLDMCGAPGGKATLAIDQLPEDGVLVANEVIRNRFPALLHNLIRWGDPRAFATNLDPSFFRKKKTLFDLVLVDAPCSGEGLFRKDPEASSHWSVEHVNHCSLRQKRILSDADQCLKNGGYLIYSTCTYNETENFGSLQELIKSGKYESVPVPLDHSWGITALQKDGVFGYSCYPHLVRGEGFFFTLLKKKQMEGTPSRKSSNIKIRTNQKWPVDLQPDDPGLVCEKGEELFYLRKESQSAFSKLDGIRDRMKPALILGRFKGKDPVPDHALAQARGTEGLPSIELELENAIKFLKKEPFVLENTEPGWLRVTYRGLGLGWIKVLQNRINNYYPSEYRIRK